ncbi:PQ-loop domain-containing transporter [Nocardioides abyssi]|uniref:PQ-loop domain-containing transporter n=1 Tax=Nocardioides abyssi TaxID=3058370 RepID=A0ABT8EVS2_9ACTN|nr:PQ-loop domain-containing transporter [Nocardioides abyssi]MDN4162179.1 PQ-loop domain-containing transporter [Nocardioides abyssi]
MPAAAFCSVAVTLSLLTQLPQVHRALRTRVTDGLSTGTLGLSLLCCASWCAYGMAVLDVAQVANNVVNLALLALLAHALVLAGALRRWQGVVLVAGSVGTASAVAQLTSPVAAATMAATIGFGAKVPQVRVALSGAPLWGLAPLSVVLGFVSPALWAGYGFVTGDPVVLVASLVSGALSAVILWRRLPPRRTLGSLSTGRLGPRVARVAAVVETHLPQARHRAAA